MRRQGAALASREEEAGTVFAPPGLLWGASSYSISSCVTCATVQGSAKRDIYAEPGVLRAPETDWMPPPAEGRSAGCHRLPLDGPSPPSLTGRLADARALRPAANWESSEQHYQSSSSFPHVEPGARRPRGARRSGAPLAPPIPRRRARPARKSQGPRAPRAARGKRAMCGGGGGGRQSGRP